MKICQRIFLILLFSAITIPSSVYAISLEKSTYYANESILVNSTGGPWCVFNTTTGQFLGTGSTHEVGDDLSGLINNVTASYSIVETNTDDNCGDLNYSGCMASAKFVGEFLFQVAYHPSAGGTPPADVSTGGGGGGPTAYRPEIGIYSPIDGKTYGNLIDIIYEATDKNDDAGQGSLGLPQFPVTIYYSTSADTRQKVLLGSNLLAKDIFKWDTKELPEGESYNIIIDATDKVGETGESVSGIFSVDHTAPIFTIKTDPSVTMGEDVKIIVDSTKELVEAPVVKVAQNEFNFFDIAMQGSGKHFEGVYKVVSGYDGPAEIKISGKDLSGNISELVVGGGQFSVGIEPPPKPIILSPFDKETVSSNGVVSIAGKARKDTEVVMSVNGTEKFSTNPKDDSLFSFPNIKLRSEFNYGVNTISIISKDAARNISESADISLKFNIAPEIFIESPSSGQTLGTSTTIVIKATDKNKDKLKFDLGVSKDKGASWSVIASSLISNIYVWNTTMFADGEYYLRATVNDGTSKKTVVVENLSIKNYLPTFYFEEGEKSFTNAKEYLISGSVSTSVKISPRPNIVSAEYSLDGGENWHPVISEGGKANMPELKFSIPMSSLEEKKYNLKLRAKDDRGMYGRGLKTLVVIFEPPKVPIVSSIKNGEVIDDTKDKNKNIAGIQIDIAGTSKPKNAVKIVSSGGIFSSIADESGEFLVGGVTIKSHGKNVISAFAEDEAGNKSLPVEFFLIYNNPPVIKFLNPRAGRGINHKTSIDFSVTDVDGDNITKTVLSYKAPEEKNFRSLDINSVGNKFEFDVTNFKEGFGYELRLDSSDGISSASKTVQFYVDNTLPEIKINPTKEKNFKKDFKFEASGSATDNLSGIEFVEYSLDEEHWFKAVIGRGYLTNKAEFNIRHPFTLDDGEYEIKFRSVDSAGNQSPVWTETISVDTMPPRMGSFEFSYNGVPLYPENGIFEVVVGSVLEFRMSLEADTDEAAVMLNKNKINLNQDPATGLWVGKLVFDKSDEFSLQFNAKDEFGNHIEDKKIGGIIVSEKESVNILGAKDGSILPVEGAKISTLIFSEDEQAFIKCPAESYGFANPTESDADGKYTLFLPAGKFTISIQKPGFVNLKTNEFSISNPKFINVPFLMKKREGVRGFIEDILDKFVIF